MARSNLNTQAKRKRELAKKDKRAAKDEKRAQKKAQARVERSTVEGEVEPTAQPSAVSLSAAAFVRRMNKTS